MFSLINILCLSTGISFSLIIGVYINNEKNVNAHLKNIDRQYILKSNWKNPNTAPASTTVGPLAKTLKEQYPDLIESYYRFIDLNTIVSANNNTLRQNIALADTNLVSMYGFSLIAGSRDKVFKDNRSAVISSSLAVALFGNTHVINKIINVQTHNSSNYKQSFFISAVIEDHFYNSILNINEAEKYDVFLPITCDTLFSQSDASKDWNNVFVKSFVKLKSNVKISQVSNALHHIIKANTSDFIKSNLNVEPASLKTYYLNENNGATKKIIFAVSLIAVFILLMATINFVNLNIGLSIYRIKEIGLRKVFGSNKVQLILQYLLESVLLTIFAAVLSILLYEFSRPLFNTILNTTFVPFYKFRFEEVMTFVIFIILLGLFSGIYPAFILSSTTLLKAVKGKMDEATSGIKLRKALLIVQFTVAIIVFIGAIIITRQVKFFFKKDLGYDKNQVLVISSLPAKWDSLGVIKMESTRDEVSQIAGIRNASLSTDIPDGKPSGSATLIPELAAGKKLICPIIAADQHFASVYGIHLKEGAFFEKNYTSGRIVINESAEKAFGWSTATGQHFHEVAGVPLTVGGVIKDFNIASLHDQVQPLVIMNVKDLKYYNYLSVKVNSNNVHQVVSAIQAKWKELYPEIPFEYFFMNDKFQSLYKSDLQLEKASVIATVLNLIIVFLGVIGVVSLAIAKRTKEIAVRKILGADTVKILILFIKEYSLSMLFANLMGWPLAYFITSYWLQMYAYRIQQSIIPFILVGSVMFMTITIIIIIQCFKVAESNPINSIRAD